MKIEYSASFKCLDGKHLECLGSFSIHGPFGSTETCDCPCHKKTPMPKQSIENTRKKTWELIGIEDIS